MTTEHVVELEPAVDPLRLFGQYDQNVTALEALVPVVVRLDGNRVRVSGEEQAVARAGRALDQMIVAAGRGNSLTPDDVALAVRQADNGAAGLPQTLLHTHRGREIRPRTAGQAVLTAAIERATLTFAIGPAGTGKTFLAVAMAVRALRARQVSRLILSRPAVEAGERLGFLPGDLREKVDPYLRPLYDALGELLDESVVQKHLERGTIEVAPIAYMRGRTLSNAFVILDEAQNATHEQLKMFLTRLGSGSKMVVNGDITQIDLPRGVRSGLLGAPGLFGDIPGIEVVSLDETDVVRHPLVSEIVRAYARHADEPRS
ncbi:MAG: PhoH family protein [Candidatus Eremiobacteraeota bacterium]|nr:PhoH family protein [Candidatus Eremiobacteraeota bacterium]MBV8355270.1 PhoH family protein [Candidatus Eremiobacteraeota bacterium]